ncbi:MAG: serine protease [Myxococcales bacterium]|nr:serine protease [Myxococcales bacterium]
MGTLFLSLVFSLSITTGFSAKTVYKQASPAVVLILGSDGGKSGGAGTGSIITPDGKILTNAHVVLNHDGQPFKPLYVFLKPQKLTGDNAKDLTNRYKASILAYSSAEDLDLAIIQVENGPTNLPTIGFAASSEVEIGDEVAAIGHPEQGGLWTLTTGTVSTLIANHGRVPNKNVFQTEASINRGNSGGPLLNKNGKIIGINTSIARQAADGVAITDVNFSLQSAVAMNWINQVGSRLGEAAKSGVPVATSAAELEIKDLRKEKRIYSKKSPPKARASEKPKAAERVVAGKRLDPKKAKPKIVTPKRPFSLADLRRKQMQDMEDMLDDMRGFMGRGKSK